jgi:hypothetical protein
MSNRFPSNKVMRRRGALKHGAYSQSVLLPGEDPRQFKILHADLVEELAPEGRLQEETVAAIAELVWRRQNLKIVEVAPLVTLASNAVANSLLDRRPNEKSDEELRELDSTRVKQSSARKRSRRPRETAHCRSRLSAISWEPQRLQLLLSLRRNMT